MLAKSCRDWVNVCVCVVVVVVVVVGETVRRQMES